MRPTIPTIKQSLKVQFRNQLLISIGILILAFIVILNLLYLKGREVSTQQAMSLIGNYYAHQYARNPSIALPNSHDFSIYTRVDQLPAHLQEHVQKQPLADQQLSLYRGNQGFSFPPPRVLSTLLPVSIAGGDGRLLLVFNAHPAMPPPPSHGGRPGHPPPPMLDNEPAIDGPPAYMALAIAMAVLVILWLASRLIKLVLKPLGQLTHMAQQLPDYQPNDKHPIMHNDTEIGLVARTLHHSAKVIHSAREREKHFTQNASHELRTPIAVVGSCLDVMQRRISQGNSKVDDQIAYIRQANNNMRELSEALLWLGRDSTYPAPTSEVNLQAMSAEICAQLDYLLEGRDVQVKVSSSDESKLELSLSLSRIVIGNIIRNAFEHTWSGHVHVDINTHTLIVNDSGEGIDNKNSQQLFERGEGDGFGLGLNIVQQICQRQCWLISARSNDAGGCSIKIEFNKRGNTHV